MSSLVNPRVTKWGEIPDKPEAFTPSAHRHDWGDLNGIPSAFPPSPHSHEIEDVDGLADALDAKMDKMRIERLSLTSDGSGNVSAIYSPAFASTPNVHLELLSTNNRNAVRLTASSATGFTAVVEQRGQTLLSLLGLDILLASVTPVSGATVYATVTEP